MTTDELVRLIEQDAASHRLHDCDEVHRHMAPIVTIGSLFQRAGVARRHIEEAIRQARLEGVAIVTDSPDGVHVARTSEEAEAQSAALYDRIRSRRVTAARVYLASRKMRVEEDAAAKLTLWSAAA